MAFTIPKRYRGTTQILNVIPFVDVLFQLIIFFALACTLIEAEHFPISVPDKCDSANVDDQKDTQFATITVLKDDSGKCKFAVGTEKISASNIGEAAEKVALILDTRLKVIAAENRVVTLRIDKDVPFSEAQYALAAIAKSTATDIRLAVIKEEANPE
jgi:biopolymer transport protein ExbD